MKNNNENPIIVKVALVLVIVLCISYSAVAGKDSSLPKGSAKMITSVEGNLIYYANVGDKVQKGAPLFFVKTNDWPVGKIKQIKEDIVYYKKTYERNKKLATTNAVAIQALDDSWRDYNDSLNQLEIAKQQCENGFYTAPFDCEIVKRELPPGSGIGDGNPVMYIKEIPAGEFKKTDNLNTEKK
jgi:hypothetical protein